MICFHNSKCRRSTAFGVCHVFDIHWKISTQAVFDGVLTYDEMLPRAQPAPGLGPHAMTAGAVDALLLACIHPVMHHRNEQRVLWIYDIHLLAGRLSAHQFAEFTRLARQKQVAGICAHQLRLAQTVFQTALPPGVIADLSRPGDPRTLCRLSRVSQTMASRAGVEHSRAAWLRRSHQAAARRAAAEPELHAQRLRAAR